MVLIDAMAAVASRVAWIAIAESQYQYPENP